MPLNAGYLRAKTDRASDEVFTPAYAVEPLIKYLKVFKSDATVWCPFDQEWSEYVKIFKKNGFQKNAGDYNNAFHLFQKKFLFTVEKCLKFRPQGAFLHCKKVKRKSGSKPLLPPQR